MIYLIVGGRTNNGAETECKMRMEEVIGGNERGAEVSEAREGSSTQEVSAWACGLRHPAAQAKVELFGYLHLLPITVFGGPYCLDFLDFTSVDLICYMIDSLPSRDYVSQ